MTSTTGELAAQPNATEQLSEGDVISLLSEQHVRIRRLFMDVKAATGRHRQHAFDELRALLAVHETVEDLVIRPITAKVAGKSVAAELTREEEDILLRLTCLESLNCAGRVFHTFFPAFEAAVVHHTMREEREELPAIRESCDAAMREEMGARISAVGLLVPTHPHPFKAADSVRDPWMVPPLDALIERTRARVAREGHLSWGHARM